MELVGLCLRMVLYEKRKLFLTLEQQGFPPPQDPEAFRGQDGLRLLDLGGLGKHAHSVAGPKEFSSFLRLRLALTPRAKDQVICS